MPRSDMTVTLSQSPEGSTADFHHELENGLSIVILVSQSPEGSTADFHNGVQRCGQTIYQQSVSIPRRVDGRFPLDSRFCAYALRGGF